MIFKAMRLLGALALLGVGAVHLQQYYAADYSGVPTIGPLFLLNGIGSGILGVALLLPVERMLRARNAHALLSALTIGGVMIAAGSLIALFISESGGLFGFIEPGYSLPVVLAIVSETATLILLAPVAAISLRKTLLGRRTPVAQVGW